MSAIPSWAIALIKLAIQLGSPYLLNLLTKWMGTLPEEIKAIINELINALKDPKVSNSIAKKEAARKIKECAGVGCVPDTK